MESIWAQTPENRPIAVAKAPKRDQKIDQKIFRTIDSPETGSIEPNPRKRLFEGLEGLEASIQRKRTVTKGVRFGKATRFQASKEMNIALKAVQITDI